MGNRNDEQGSSVQRCAPNAEVPKGHIDEGGVDCLLNYQISSLNNWSLKYPDRKSSGAQNENNDQANNPEKPTISSDVAFEGRLDSRIGRVERRMNDKISDMKSSIRDCKESLKDTIRSEVNSAGKDILLKVLIWAIPFLLMLISIVYIYHDQIISFFKAPNAFSEIEERLNDLESR